MKIGLDIPTNLPGEAVHGSKADRRTDAVRERSAANADDAVLSTDLARIQLLQAELRNLPEIRNEKVEALRQAVANGNYHVSPEKIAEAMYRDIGMLL